MNTKMLNCNFTFAYDFECVGMVLKNKVFMALISFHGSTSLLEKKVFIENKQTV